MNRKDIAVLYTRELRSALREPSIVIKSIVLPIVVYPLLVWLVSTGYTYVSGQTAGMRSHIMLRNLPEAHRPLLLSLELEPGIEIVTSRHPEEDIRNGSLDLLIDFVTVQDAPPLEEGNVGARVTYDASRDQSATARVRVKSVIDRYRDRFIEREASKLGISRIELAGFRVVESNLSDQEDMGRYILGLMLPVLFVMMIGIGAIYPAIDTTAGERETGTWETMMTTATSRGNILVAKYLYVATMAFAAGCLNVAGMMFTLRSSLISLSRDPGSLEFSTPLAAIPIFAAGAALLALLISAGMMIVAVFARTFREGQSAATPFLAAFMLPVLFIPSPTQDFTIQLAFIPIVNVAMMFRQAINGSYDWPLIAITMAVQAVSILVVLRFAALIAAHEDIAVGNYNGSFMRFVRTRLFRRIPMEARRTGAS